MKLFIFFFTFLVLLSCQQSKKDLYGINTILKEVHPGKKLLEEKCYVCHSPNASHDNRLAPPMIAVKKHYISKNTTKEAFIEAMQNWVENPNKENAKMYGAVNRFGVMPKLEFSEETIKKISDYMFDYDIDQPEWFEEHYQEQQGKGMGQSKGRGKQMQQGSVNIESLPYGDKGVKYALSTKAVLGKNLIGKIQEEGTLKALKFCNEKAYPLTDSMSVKLNASIKRVSDKPRNIKNKANLEELKFIDKFKKDASSNIESEPIVVETSENVNVYYPIKTNSMCLQCHGTPKKQVSENTLLEITKLYPKDKALGYDINQVRGIWNVSFLK